MRESSTTPRPATRAATAPAIAQTGAAAGIIADLVLARLAVPGGATRSELVKDLSPYLVHRMPAGVARAAIEAAITRLEAAGDVSEARARLTATTEGARQAHALLGPKNRTKTWADVRDGGLVAAALDMAGESAARLKLLGRPDGLRGILLQKTYGLPAKACASPSRLRTALAVVALQRAFGDGLSGGIGAGDGLSAKAGRLLAGQLSATPRDFGTDTRLIAALAAESVGAAKTDTEALRLAIVRGFVDRRHGTGPEPTSQTRAPTSPSPGRPVPGTRAPAPPAPIAPARAASVEPAALEGEPGPASPTPRSIPAANDRAPVPPPASPSTRPDLPGFAREVQRAAAQRAEGWPGNRKAFISLVWQVIRVTRAEWGLSEIEFKCMLTEAHRAGLVVLAYADLKDKRYAREFQESAIAYKNTVWHYVRVED